jgi:uncharacterized repeat protein (TIGR03843 family)
MSTEADALLLLGELVVEGRLVDASNATLYAKVSHGAEEITVIYKPIRGERPLWDFPDGTLAQRELATFLIDRALGWNLVPTTTLRDGPFGPGMVQTWIDVDETVDLVDLVHSRHPDLQRIVVLDAVVNNADRKGGHLLPLPSGAVMAIDHGVTLHTQDKLRTVLWQWEGEPLPTSSLVALENLAAAVGDRRRPGPLAATLQQLLTAAEVQALRRRVDRLLTTGVHPSPSPDWPAVPWPPF